MRLKINGINFGGSSKYQIKAPIEGLEKPPIRISYNNYSGRDGGYVSSQFYSPREIVVNGFWIANTCAEADDLRATLARSMEIRKILPFFVTTFGNHNYSAETYISDFKMNISGLKAGEFQITLIAPDPFLYDAGDMVNPDSGWMQAYFYKAIPGGYKTPYKLPVLWTSGTTSTSIYNNGNIIVYPQLVLEGQFTNPKITNETTGKFVQLNMTTTAGDKIIIDMKNREITLNGGSVAANRTIDSSWWELLLGENKILLTTSSGSDASQGIIRWKPGVETA